MLGKCELNRPEVQSRAQVKSLSFHVAIFPLLWLGVSVKDREISRKPRNLRYFECISFAML